MKKVRRAVTLIEVMVVIFLIGLIGGALAFSMRGSLDQGKVFHSEQNAMKLYDILMMEYAKGNRTLEEIIKDYQIIAKKSPLSDKGDKIFKDAWGKEFIVELSKDGEDIKIYSEKVSAFKKKHL
ncbi:type II secretion system protein [Candidatus Clavichlamydia salmonicola]|uniref:type II secretion system protein n=1 Tax=Candidatus Clavichlamydia salmonicola TaxID=469812 RepID=UPI00189198D3|nr:type II secretion system protein [Candidatus Clavichlamydia salmonicola]